MKILAKAKKYSTAALLVCAALVALFSSASGNLIRALDLGALVHDPQDSIAALIACQTSVLPGFGTIGYIIHADGSSKELRNPQFGYHFFLSQLLLAPRVLDLSTGHRWIVANLVDPSEMDSISKLYHASMIKVCGVNSAVFERTDLP